MTLLIDNRTGIVLLKAQLKLEGYFNMIAQYIANIFFTTI